MKRPVKAALLSGLVFPGVGHFFLRRYVSGFVLGSIGAVTFYILLSHAVSTARVLAERILNGEIAANVTNIRDLIVEQQTADETQLISIATSLFIGVWIIAIADSFRVGRNMDKGQ